MTGKRPKRLAGREGRSGRLLRGVWNVDGVDAITTGDLRRTKAGAVFGFAGKA